MRYKEQDGGVGTDMQEDLEGARGSFDEYRRKYTRLVIYGAGDVGRMVAEFMNRERIPFEGFCVTKRSGNRMLAGHEIREIDEMICPGEKTGIIVAVSRKNAEEILKILDGRGLSCFYSTEFLFYLFREKCRVSASAVQIRDGFLSGVGDVVFERDTTYICCPASIGDTLYTAAFVREYKAEKRGGRICLILKKSHRELGTLFPAVDEILVSDEIVEILDRYSMYTQTWRLKNYIYGHFKKSLRFVYDPEYGREDCRSILPRYRRLIMNLPDDAGMEDLALEKNGRERNVQQAEKRESDIVIMPYARTAAMLPDSFWEELVCRLKRAGRTVYTNIGGEKEKAISGTAPMAESLLDTARFCETCGAVIALRSGLCDLLGFTQANLIVINTSEELSVEWNLNDVFGREGIQNIDCFESTEYNKRIDEIMKAIG